MDLYPKTLEFDTEWATLKELVALVISQKPFSRKMWNEGFTNVRALCVSRPDPLDDRLYTETKILIEEHVISLLIKVNGSSEDNLLEKYYKLWQEYSKGIEDLNNLYSYLNNNYITATNQSKIQELGLILWKKHMIMPLKADLLRFVLGAVQCERAGHLNEEVLSTFQGVIQSLVSIQQFKKKKKELKLYEKVFEGPFLEAIGEYYGLEASRILQECSSTLPTVKEKLLILLNEEYLRSRRFMHQNSYHKLRIELEQRMKVATIHHECPTMMQDDRLEDLRDAYEFLKSVPGGLPDLVSQFMEHVKQRGLCALSNLSEGDISLQFVEGIIKLHSKYTEITNTVFSDDTLFRNALDRACSSIVNHRVATQRSQTPKMLAKYCHFLLKNSKKGGSDTNIDEKLTQCMTVLNYMEDKDIFLNYYSQFLGKRLISPQGLINMGREEVMINRLKQAYGYELTTKIRRMFTDTSVSLYLTRKFNLLKDRDELEFSFSIRVLQSGTWPFGQGCDTDFAIPQELASAVQCFEDFYRTQFTGRKLTWLSSLDEVEVKLNYLDQPYIFKMGTIQMAILLVFQNNNSVTWERLLETIKLNSDQLKRTIQSLVDSKLLEVANDSVEVFQPSTIISLNMDFSSKRTKFRITNVQKETVQELEPADSSVIEGRKHYLQAIIVRIMKSRKILRHNVLFEKVLSQSKDRFVPSVDFFKKCVQRLIEKEYLNKTSEDEYSYVA